MIKWFVLQIQGLYLSDDSRCMPSCTFNLLFIFKGNYSHNRTSQNQVQWLVLDLSTFQKCIGKLQSIENLVVRKGEGVMKIKRSPKFIRYIISKRALFVCNKSYNKFNEEVIYLQKNQYTYISLSKIFLIENTVKYKPHSV